MEISKGMYVRYIRGMINGYVPPRVAKIVDCSDNKLVKIDNEQIILRSDIIGEPSFNIIDLIEVGDYINGYPVVDILECYDNDTKRKINRIVYIDKAGFETDNRLTIVGNNDIKDIITKEQFNSMKYVVEGDD